MGKSLKRVTRATDPSALTLHTGVAALDPETLHQEAQASVQALLEEGQSENTARAYAGALRYWAAWFHLRYRATLALPVPVPVVPSRRNAPTTSAGVYR